MMPVHAPFVQFIVRIPIIRMVNDSKYTVHSSREYLAIFYKIPSSAPVLGSIAAYSMRRLLLIGTKFRG